MEGVVSALLTPAQLHAEARALLACRTLPYPDSKYWRDPNRVWRSDYEMVCQLRDVLRRLVESEGR